ncbi:hypothetical protein [uncultured Methylobacterium sp.]|jgi:hypothetical protein|uniref:hypothetical protein n=1 Tax=uncultured Methylobacterium sp. TaxID=157278 RepID=UPI00260C1339|nr:hypothetical protein [uncultured Methylobacterium sp.]
MASSPPDAPAGQYRVVRLHKRVTEAFVTATTTASALAIAVALGTNDWRTRPVLQPAGEDAFEYNVVAAKGSGGPQTPYTLATNFVAGSVGMRWPNKQGTLNNAAFTKTCETLFFIGAPWVVPAGQSAVVGFSDRFRLEGDQAGTNEQLFANDHTIEAVSLSYTDTQGVARVATAFSISGGGVCGPGSTTVGGVLATLGIPADMPANPLIKIMVARSVAAGGQVPAYYRIKSGIGESFRGHATASFATVVNAGQDASANTGSASAGINNAGGSSPGPSFICFKGSDGRPATINLGHSLLEGKGTDDLNTPTDRSKGMLSVGLASTANGYIIPHIDISVAGADFQRRDPGNANYNPNIMAGMLGLIAQVSALNGGTPPFSHGISADYNNSETSPLSAQVALIKAASIGFLRRYYPGLPIIRTTSEIAVSATTDGFATLSGQTAKSPVDRAAFNVKLYADLLDGTCQYALDIMTALSATGSSTSTSADQGKFIVLPLRPTVTRAYTGGGASIYLSAAPRLGTAINKLESGGSYQTKVVTAVAAQPEGDFLVTVANGNGNSTWGDAAVGVVLQEQLSADGNPSVIGGLHYSQVANGLIAAYPGPNGMAAVKAQLKAAANGAWV